MGILGMTREDLKSTESRNVLFHCPSRCAVLGFMNSPRPIHDHLTEVVIACIIRVHQVLGPGYLESIYRRALLIELRRQNLKVEVEKEIPVYYGLDLVGRHRVDLIVESRLIVELKTVESLGKSHYAQLRSYLKATDLKTGILVNFASETADFRRVTPQIPRKSNKI
jgi:GxxExxY protein